MRRLRFLLVIGVVSISVFVATNPVFAAAGGNGNCNGNNCDPGKPVLPEAPIAVMLPIIGFAVIGLVLFVIYRRQRPLDTVAE